MRYLKRLSLVLVLSGVAALAGCNGSIDVESSVSLSDLEGRERSDLVREIARMRLRDEEKGREEERLRLEIEALRRGHPGAREMTQLLEQLGNLSEQVRRLQVELIEARASRPATDVTAATSPEALRIEIDALRREAGTLRRRVEQRDEIIARLIEAGIPVYEIASGEAAGRPAVPVRAEVIAYIPETGRVMLSAGSEQGVKEGHVFAVWRGEKFIARVEVQKLFKKMSSARVIESSPGAEVCEGDEARS